MLHGFALLKEGGEARANLQGHANSAGGVCSLETPSFPPENRASAALFPGLEGHQSFVWIRRY